MEIIHLQQSTRAHPCPLERADQGAQIAAAFGIRRSPHWPEVVKEHLALQPTCVCCLPNIELKVGLQVHHIFPFHYCIALGRPNLELDERNLITLCGKSHGGTGANHHLWIVKWTPKFGPVAKVV